MSENTRTSGSIIEEDTFVLDMPFTHYKPLRIGFIGRKTKLEEILEYVKLEYEHYIWYTDITKVTILNHHLI